MLLVFILSNCTNGPLITLDLGFPNNEYYNYFITIENKRTEGFVELGDIDTSQSDIYMFIMLDPV